jgi:VHL beta domain
MSLRHLGRGRSAATLCAFSLATSACAADHLANLGCSTQSLHRSMTWSTATAVTFVNRTTSPVRTYWIDYEGARVFYAEIAPCGGYVQQTYLTHPWVITGAEGEDCLAVFLPARGPGIADIEPARGAKDTNVCAPPVS